MNRATLARYKRTLNEHLIGVRKWDDLQRKLRDISGNDPKRAGGLFECFCLAYFHTHPTYMPLVKSGHIQGTFLSRHTRDLRLPSTTDVGIDMILEGLDGKLWAVQAKFKSDPRNKLALNRDRLGNFGLSSRRAKHKVLISNSVGVSNNFLRQFEKDPSFQTILYDRFCAITADQFRRMRQWLGGQEPSPPQKRIPDPHQHRAIRAARKHFKKEDRGKLIHPCGSGKTLTALWIKEALDARRTLVCMPSISILRKTIEIWAEQSKKRFVYQCVCSHSDIAEGAHDSIGDITESCGFED